MNAPAWGRVKAERLLEAELERAERDGIPFEEGVQGSELALAGYLAGIREALLIVRGER